MRIQYGTTILSTGDVLATASDIRLNGRQVVDVQDLLRAAAPQVHGRGNRSHVLSFLGTRTFPSLLAAEVFMLTHEQQLADKATLYCVCGLGATTQVVTLPGAVFEGWDIVHKGRAMLVRYTFRGPRFATEVVEIPDEESLVKRGSADIDAGEWSGAVAFAAPFAAAPIVTATIEAPAADALAAHPTIHGVGVGGFSWYINAATPASGYKLHWIAVGT